MKKKIAIIGLKGLPAFGGAARSFENIIKLLRDDFDITVYAIESHTKVKGFYDGYEQIVFKSHKKSLLNVFNYYWKSLFHVLFIRNYDLIHLNHAESGFITPFLRLKYNVITTFHGVFHKNKFDMKFSKWANYFFRFSQKLNLIFSSVVVSVSKDDIEFCKSISNRKIQFIPNGVFLNESVDSNKINETDYILFAAGRIYELKGCHLFLEALQLIKHKGKVIIIGDLNQVPSYKNTIIELSKGLNVKFIPLIKDKSLLMGYIKKAKLFVFPSLFEAMSNMLLETASMKTPILCSDIIANKDIFNSDEVTFFESNNASDLSQNLDKLLLTHNDNISKAEKAYEKLSREYTWGLVSERYKEIYTDLIGE